MRDIRFRGKRKDDGKWVEGSFVECARGAIMIKPGHIHDLSEREQEEWFWQRASCIVEFHNADEFIEVDPETVGQFSDEKDTKKTRICEGDIVEVQIYSDEEPEVLEVKYRGSAFVIDYEDGDSGCQLLSAFPGTVFIIGNRWGNQEMLEVKDGTI